jgi:CDP-glycerol glycerophosphotransferase
MPCSYDGRVPRISVVVPIFNVEPYLRDCLESIARQTVSDLEVILVDDGSTDGSAAIAEQFAAKDSRFRLIRQPNGGLGHARNTGVDAASGEFLAFVDGDDMLPDDAYELLLGSLDRTASDFATGNVHRISDGSTIQAPFLAKPFAKTRRATHVTRFRPLIVDRIVPNKLWRRGFWDDHGFRFPEGMLHEDIPVAVPAHFAARSVDVISKPVYHYRVRAGEDQSITQRRADLRALLGRLTAVEQVSGYIGRHVSAEALRWYHESVVAEDLRYYLDVLDVADDEYRTVFLERVNAFLDRVDDRAFEQLAAIERLKWHLVRRRLMPELLEVLRFQKEDLVRGARVRVGGKWFGDYPFRTDPDLRIPGSVYQLTLRSQVSGLVPRRYRARLRRAVGPLSRS